MTKKEILEAIRNLSDKDRAGIIHELTIERDEIVSSEFSKIEEEMPALCEEYNKLALELGVPIIQEIMLDLFDHQKQSGYNSLYADDQGKFDGWYSSSCYV